MLLACLAAVGGAAFAVSAPFAAPVLQLNGSHAITVCWEPPADARPDHYEVVGNFSGVARGSLKVQVLDGRLTVRVADEPVLGALGGAFAFFYGVGKPLPIPECQPYKPSLQLRMLGWVSRVGKKIKGLFGK